MNSHSAPDKPATTESVAQAERGVLGALILDCLRFHEIRGRLAPDDFAVYQHRVVYECIEAIVSRDAAVDYVGLSAELEQRGRLEAFGGLGFLIELGNSVTSPAFLLSHVAVVLEASQRRKLEASALSVVKEVRQGKPIEEIALPERVRASASPATLLPDPGPFPSHLLEPPGLVGDICAWVNDTAIRPQPILTLACVLTSCGALFGRRYKSPTNLRTNIYAIGLAPTAAGKQHARDQIKLLFNRAGRSELLGGERLASGQGILGALNRSPSSVFMLDEFGSVLHEASKPGAQGHHRAIIDILLQLHSSAGGVFLGAEYAKQDDKNRRVDVEQPCACVYATSTPETFYPALSSRRAVDGFLNRTIIFETDNPDPDDRLPTDMEPPEALVFQVRDAWDAGFSGNGAFRDITLPGSQIAVHPRLVPTQDDATAFLVGLNEQARSARRARAFMGTANLWGRLVENTIRMALIQAIARNAEMPSISLADAEWASEIALWSIRHLEKACAERISDSPFEADCKRLLMLIRKAGLEGLKQNLLTRATQDIDTRRRKDLIESLTEAGLIRASAVKAGGRPAATYFSE